MQRYRWSIALLTVLGGVKLRSVRFSSSLTQGIFESIYSADTLYSMRLCL